MTRLIWTPPLKRFYRLIYRGSSVTLKRDKTHLFGTREERNLVLYHRQLLKGELEALCVVCNPFCCDVLHSVLQQLFVSDVGLNQVVKAGCLLHSSVELGNIETISYTRINEGEKTLRKLTLQLTNAACIPGFG